MKKKSPLRINVLPESYLKLMDEQTRKEIGQMTIKEAVETCEVRLEKDLHKLIELELNRRDICYFHQRMDKASGGRKGWPDFTFCIGGKPFAIEVKTKTRKLSDDQALTLMAMHCNGWNTAIVRSFEQFLEVIK